MPITYQWDNLTGPNGETPQLHDIIIMPFGTYSKIIYRGGWCLMNDTGFLVVSTVHGADSLPRMLERVQKIGAMCAKYDIAPEPEAPPVDNSWMLSWHPLPLEVPC